MILHRISKALSGAPYAAMAMFLTLCGSAYASEDRKSVYLIGVRASLSGMMPPPGFYASSFTYLYSGTTGNNTVKVKAEAVLDLVSLTWVSSEKVMGGNFGLALYVPIAHQRVSARLSGATPGTWTSLSGSTTAVGDPLASAFIGWQSGNFHWKLSGVVNIPVGSYSRTSLANIGFNRWAGDITASMTWLDPTTNVEFSIAPGVTFNGTNPATNYRTGAELHIEAALMKHVSKSFAFGLAGYHLRQLTGDSGAGAVFGSFKGEVSAIGPNLTYNFQVGKYPVYSSIRWMREFNAKNRLKGDVGFLTLTVPIM